MPSDEVDTPQQDKIWFLQGLRGIAASLVVIDHLVLGFWQPNNNLLAVFSYLQPKTTNEYLAYYGAYEFLTRLGIEPGTFGVALFFLISGFVIPISLEKIGGVRFLTARFFRIFPTYIVGFSITFTVIFLYTWANHIVFPFNWQSYLAQILLIRDWL